MQFVAFKFYCSGNAEEERNTLCFRALDDKFLVSHQKNIMSLADYMHFISATKGVAEVELLGHTLEQKVHPKAWTLCFSNQNYDTITKNKSSMPTCFKCLCGTVPCQAAAAGDAAADSDATVAQDPLPVPYRFTVSGNRACLHTVFKPASLGADDGQEKGVRPELRPKSFGNHCHDTVLCIMAVTIYYIKVWLQFCCEFALGKRFRMLLRAGSLGAIFVGQMDKLPRSDNAQVVWEASRIMPKVF
jgi:hypothetical protein